MKMRSILIPLFAAVFAVFCAAACSVARSSSTGSDRAGGEAGSTPSSRAAALLGLTADIGLRKEEVHGVLILHEGKVLYEAYPYPRRAGLRHRILSCTKSVLSLLVGIAAADGEFPPPETPVSELFPEESRDWSGAKRNLSVRHLLTMTTGLQWSETGSYSGPEDSYTAMWRSPDPVQYVLQRPLTGVPGEAFQYNSGASHLLSAILQDAVGRPAAEFARDRLFDPLGIQDWKWKSDRQGRTAGSDGLVLSAADLASIGTLLLPGGADGYSPPIPLDWIRESTKKQVDTPTGLAGRYGYGYQWWINPFGGYSARGFGGQYLFVVPEEKLVAVFFGGLFSGFFLPETWMARWVLPAARSLAEGTSEELALLSKAVTELESGPPARAVPPLPPAAHALSAGVWIAPDDSRNSFSFPGGAEGIWTLSQGGETYELPFGLDGRFREGTTGSLGPAEPNPIALRGRWDDDRTFILEYTWLEDPYLYEQRWSIDAGESNDGATAGYSESVPALGQVLTSGSAVRAP